MPSDEGSLPPSIYERLSRVEESMALLASDKPSSELSAV